MKRKNKVPAAQVEFPDFVPPLVHYPTITIPQGNGEFLIKAGKPEILGTEISTAKFARETGMSQRNAVRLCEEGLVNCRRLSPKSKSKYMIAASDVHRFRKLEEVKAA